MNMRTKSLIYFNHKLCYNIKEKLWRNMIIQSSDLKNTFLRTCFFTFQQIVSCTITFRMTIFFISGILIIHKVLVLGSIKVLLHFFKWICQFVCFIIMNKVSVTIVTVPVDIFFCLRFIDMLTIVDIKISVIMFWIISAILSGTTIVSCQFHCDFLLFWIPFRGC